MSPLITRGNAFSLLGRLLSLSASPCLSVLHFSSLRANVAAERRRRSIWCLSLSLGTAPQPQLGEVDPEFGTTR